MATIPTYLYLGGPHISGAAHSGLVPQPGNRGAFWTSANNAPRLMRLVPYTGSAYLPYWDGQAGVQRTITGATASTVTVSGAPWTTGSEVGKTVIIDTGPAQPVAGASLMGVVTSNTTNQLTINGTWASSNPGPPTTFYTWTVNPTSGKLHIADGAWVRFDHISGRDVFTTLGPIRDNYGSNGENWYGDNQGGFGPVTALMQELADRHPSTPGFRLFKYANVGGFSVWGDSGSGVWAAFAAQWAKAIAAFGADTPQYRAVVIDASLPDIIAQNGNFGLNVITFVANIRALLGDANVPVILHVHASGIYAGTTANGGSNQVQPGGLEVPYSRIIRGISNTLRALISNLRIVDWEGSEYSADTFVQSIGVEPSIPAGSPSLNPKGYSTQSHIAMGLKVARAIDAFYAAAPTANASGGIPLVVLLADSQGLCVGQSPFIAILGAQASLLGPNIGSSIMGPSRIWDGQNEQWLPFDLAANSNTVILPKPEYYGPDATMFRRLGEAFPNGVLVFKIAIGGASITSEAVGPIASATYDPAASPSNPAALWPQVQAHWDKAMLAAFRDLGLVPETIAVVNVLADNDCVAEPAAALVTKLPTFVAAERALFRTRPAELGGDLLVISHLPPKHVEAGGQSVHGTAAARASVRQTLTDYAATDPRFVLLSDEGLELRRNNPDNTLPDLTHYGSEAVHELGERIGDAVVGGSAAGSGASSSGSDSSGADSVDSDEPATDAVETSAAASALSDAMALQPDVAGYTKSRDSLSVQRRTLKDMREHSDWLEQQAARDAGLSDTVVDFNP